jgi:hypothetical protein
MNLRSAIDEASPTNRNTVLNPQWHSRKKDLTKAKNETTMNL